MNTKRYTRVVLMHMIGYGLLLVAPLGVSGQDDENATSKDTTAQYEELDIAYGRQKKQNIVGAISYIEHDEIRRNGVVNTAQALPGTLPGLITMMSAGNSLGANGYNFLVRGKATNAGTSPLILIDQVERSLDDIDPNEIASIAVFKDASAQVLYGMRGANGVILITTKRGDTANRFIAVDARAGVHTPEFWAPKLDAYQYASLYNEGLVNDGRTASFSNTALEAYRTGSDPYRYPNTDYRAKLLKDFGSFQNYNFSAGGGNETLRYFTALGYLGQEGYFRFTDQTDKYSTQNKFDRFNFRTNLDIYLDHGLQFGLDVNAIISNTHSPWTFANDILTNMYNTPANAYPLLNEDGSLGGSTLYRTNAFGQIARSGLRNTQDRRLQAGVKVKQDLNFFTDGLSVNALYSIENFNPFTSGQSQSFAVFETQAIGVLDPYVQYNADTQLSSQGYSGANYFRRNVWNASLDYNRMFNHSHAVNAQFLYHQSRMSVSGDNPDYKYQNFAAKVAYDYNQKYLAEIAAAYSGSSNFTAGHRMGLFPVLGLGWIVSNEDFFTGNAVQYLKVRASTGLVGNDQISGDRYQYEQTSTAGGGYGFGVPNGSSRGSTEGALGNALISWEKSFKTNIGIDTRLWENALDVSVDYFYEKRSDIAVPQANVIPGIVGIGLPYINAGIVENKGFDFSLIYKKQLGGTSVFLGANGVLAKNKVIDLGEQIQQYAHQYRKGHSLDARFGYMANGLFQTEAEVADAPLSSFSAIRPGDIRYINQNPADDNRIDVRDQVVIGKGTVPEFYYGITMGMTYKKFDFSLLAQGATGRDIMFIPNMYSTAYYDNRWTAETTNTTSLPRVTNVTSGHNNMQTSTFWQQNGNYLRLRNIEIGYTLNNVMKISKLRIYGSGQNLATFSGLSDLDPEDQRAGYTYAPLARMFTLGVKVGI